MNQGLGRQWQITLLCLSLSAPGMVGAEDASGIFTVGRVIESKVPYRAGPTVPLEVDMAAGGRAVKQVLQQQPGLLSAQELGAVVASPGPDDRPGDALRSRLIVPGGSSSMGAVGGSLSVLTRGGRSGSLQSTLQRSTAGIGRQVTVPILQSIPGAARP